MNALLMTNQYTYIKATNVIQNISHLITIITVIIILTVIIIIIYLNTTFSMLCRVGL